MPKLTVKEYAKSRNTTDKYIYQLIEAGTIPGEAIEKSSRATLIDKELADAAVISGTDTKSKEPSVQSNSLMQARIASQSIKAALLKNALDSQNGRLIDAEKVRIAAIETGQQVREALMSIPDRVSAVIAAENDPQVVHQILESELRIALEALCDAG